MTLEFKVIFIIVGGLMVVVLAYFGGTHVPNVLEQAALFVGCPSKNPHENATCELYDATGRVPNEFLK